MNDDIASPNRGMIRRQRLPSNVICPTEKQIRHNIVVIPKAFLDDVEGKLERTFVVVLLGEAIPDRHLDLDRRISLPLRGRVKPGTTLTLSISHDALHLEMA